MLIEFAVENFRSFRERQVLSMVAEPRLKRKENTFRPELDGEEFPRLLKAAAVYGPNASGKSNLVNALSSVHEMVRQAPSATQGSLPVASFRFDSALASLPSRFELNFIRQRQRYQFILAATKSRIEEEKLVLVAKGRETLLYHRRVDDGRDVYQLGDTLEGGKQVHEAWKKLTAPTQLFLTQAVANSSAELNQLRAPSEWLLNGIAFVNDDILQGLSRVTQNMAQSSPEFQAELLEFIRDLDIPIDGMTFVPDQTTANDSADFNSDYPLLASRGTKPVLHHVTALGEARFELNEESKGTQSLFGFFTPWSVFQNAQVKWDALIVDELDTSLHPNIVRELIRRHIAKDIPSQLIFTTHDTRLMDSKLLRRDQIWLTERDINGATQLRSVHDFEGREGEDIEKRYYEGRYRALPITRSK